MVPPELFKPLLVESHLLILLHTDPMTSGGGTVDCNLRHSVVRGDRLLGDYCGEEMLKPSHVSVATMLG